MRIDVLTLFPEYFESPLRSSILGRALKGGLAQVHLHQLREYAQDRHHRVDDRSFGGGPGMVLMPGPLDAALTGLKSEKSHVVYLSPAGRVFDRHKACELASHPHIIFLCGHYEGIDQRIIDKHVDEELSIGDFVLTNGALASLVVIDAMVRFIPRVLGDEASREQDSFEKPLLDHPHYTLPREYDGVSVPEVLLSGDHQKIAAWRAEKSHTLTFDRRPDLCANWLEKSEETCENEKGLLGTLLATAHLNFYRKALSKHLRLPWIDKNATMGALLLDRGEILLWERSDRIETGLGVNSQDGVEIVASVAVEDVAMWLVAARRLSGKKQEVTVVVGSDWVSLQDPSGWKLLLKPQQIKKLQG